MNKSFTLIEILVVIVIIGILSGFIIVGMAGVSDKANIAKGQAFASSLKNSLMLNLVSEWRLDETGVDTVVKDSWGANTGAWTGPAGAYTSPSWRTASECVSGGCLAFDGTDDYVNAGTGANLNITGDQLTLGAWVKVISWSGSETYAIVAENYQANTGGYFIERDNANNYFFLGLWTAAGFNATIPTEVLSENKWYYLVGVFNSTYTKFYINGALKKTESFAATTIASSANPFVMGGKGGALNNLNGILDDVRVYNMALPTSQIRQNYYSGLNRLLAGQSIDSREYIKGLALEEN